MISKRAAKKCIDCETSVRTTSSAHIHANVESACLQKCVELHFWNIQNFIMFCRNGIVHNLLSGVKIARFPNYHECHLQ